MMQGSNIHNSQLKGIISALNKINPISARYSNISSYLCGIAKSKESHIQL